MEQIVNFEKFVIKAQENHESAKSRLCALLDEVNAEQMLTIMVTFLLVRPYTGDNNHPVLVENLAYYVFSKAAHLKGRDITHIDTAECQKKLEDLCNSSQIISAYENRKKIVRCLGQ